MLMKEGTEGDLGSWKCKGMIEWTEGWLSVSLGQVSLVLRMFNP